MGVQVSTLGCGQQLRRGHPRAEKRPRKHPRRGDRRAQGPPIQEGSPQGDRRRPCMRVQASTLRCCQQLRRGHLRAERWPHKPLRRGDRGAQGLPTQSGVAGIDLPLCVSCCHRVLPAWRLPFSRSCCHLKLPVPWCGAAHSQVLLPSKVSGAEIAGVKFEGCASAGTAAIRSYRRRGYPSADLVAIKSCRHHGMAAALLQVLLPSEVAGAMM